MRWFVLILLLSAACAPVHPYERMFWLGDPEIVWALQVLQGERMGELPGDVATVRLNPDYSVSGTVACNSRSAGPLRWVGGEGRNVGTFDRSGNGPSIVTAAGCRNPADQASADRFWKLMETARTWSTGEHRLTITFSDSSTAEFVALKRRDR